MKIKKDRLYLCSSTKQPFFKPAILYAMILMMYLVSCSNDDDGTGTTYQPTFKIVTIQGSSYMGNFNYELSYTETGLLDQMVFTNADGTTRTTDYTYGNDTITASNGEFTYTTRVNQEGHPISLTKVQDNDTMITSYSYENGVLTESTVSYNGTVSPTGTIYEWENGNVTKAIRDFDTTTIEYYTDKPLQQGDYLMINDMIQFGYPQYENTNLVKRMGEITFLDFAYEFDDIGNITKITISQSGTVVSESYYSYELL